MKSECCEVCRDATYCEYCLDQLKECEACQRSCCEDCGTDDDNEGGIYHCPRCTVEEIAKDRAHVPDDIEIFESILGAIKSKAALKAVNTFLSDHSEYRKTKKARIV